MAKLVLGNDKTKVTPAIVVGGGGGNIDELNVTPSTSAQTITASGGVDGYSPVNVAAVDASIDANITAGNIKSGVTILGVTGNVVELNGETVSVTPTTSSQTITPTAPKNAITEVSVSAVTSSIDANIQAGNIKKDVTILGVTGTYEAGGGSGTPQPNTKKQVVSGYLMCDGSELIDLTGVSHISDNALSYAYYQTNVTPTVSFTGAISVAQYAMQFMFYGCNFTNPNIDVSGITTVANYSCQYMFTNSNIATLDVSGVSVIPTYAFNSICSNCTSLTSVNMSGATEIQANGCASAFNGCSNLTTADVSGVQTITGNLACSLMFAGTGLTKISWNSLTSIGANSFGTRANNMIFYNCSALTEIHFKASAQSAVEATTGYADKWGATNATIYFDL